MRETLIILLSVISVSAFAQITPNWYDNDTRQLYYPAGQYFIGFAEGQHASGEYVEAATKRLKDAAKVEAASTIRTHIHNTTINQALSQTLHTMEGTFRQSVREFSSATQTTVDMEIPGLQIDSWQNPQNGNIAAFAWVKKSTLIRQLEKKITVCLTKAETSLDQIGQLIQTGQKIQARDLAQKTLPQFREIDEAQNMLVAVDENADEESLQLQETRKLQHRLTEIITQLKNGINVYLVVDADMFGRQYIALKNEIQGELSKLGCAFVPSASLSDWAVFVTASARKYNAYEYGNVTTFITYVDVQIAMDKTITEQRVFANQLPSEKGAHTFNYEEAARNAYKDVSPKISNIIKQQIQQ